MYRWLISFRRCATLVDIPAPDELDGRSLAPLVEGPTDDWHEHSLQ